MMNFYKPIQASVGADYGDEHMTPAIRRGRFIAPTADSSALGGGSTIPMHVLKIIISYRLSNVKVKQD